MFARQVIIFKESIRFWQRPCEVNSGSGLMHLYTITWRFNFVNQYRLYEEKMICRDSVTVEKRVSKKPVTVECDHFHVTFMLGGEVFGERGMRSRKELPPSAMWTSSEWASDLNFWVPKVFCKAEVGNRVVKFFFSIFFKCFCLLLRVFPVKNSKKTRQVLVSSSSSEVQLLRVWILDWKGKNSAAFVPLVPLVSLSYQGARRTCLGWRTASLAARKVVPLRQLFIWLSEVQRMGVV